MNLYVVRGDLTDEELGILRVNGFTPGQVVWCHGKRGGRLGLGPFGSFGPAYESPATVFHPNGGPTAENMPMRYFLEAPQ